MEFALTALLFLPLILGMTEAGHAFQVSGDLCSAVREGGRTASMDLSEVTASNQTLNQKVTQDIRNFLTANGIPGIGSRSRSHMPRARPHSISRTRRTT